MGDMRNIDAGSSGGPVVAAGGGRELTDTLLCVLPFPEMPHIFDRIRAAHPKLRIVYHELKDVTDYECFRGKLKYEVPEELYRQANILVTLAQLPLPEQAPDLDLVHFCSAGINHIATHPIYTDTSITLTTSSGIHGPQITEHVFLTLLAITHHFRLLLSWQAQHVWGGKDSSAGYYGTVHDLVGQRLGVLGYGSIGRQAANVAKALGMDVLAYTFSPRTTPDSRRDTGYIVPGTGDPEGAIPSRWFSASDRPTARESLHAFLAEGIDVLLIAVPLTDDTRHFLSEAEFDILSRPRANARKGAFVVNIARGPVVDHDALLHALKRGLDPTRPDGLTGASLDVTEPEPLNPESELWDLENVTITPHISGVGATYRERCLEVLALNLERRKNGERLVNVVDRKKGY